MPGSSLPLASATVDYSSAPGFRYNCYQLGAVVLTAVLMPTCIACVLFRFVAPNKSRRKIGWEDYSAVLALVFYMGFASCSFYIASILNGRSFKQLPLLDALPVGKISYAAEPLFPVAQTLARTSIAILYYRVFSGGLALIATKVIFVFNWLICIPCVIVMLFTCLPVEKQWDPSVEGSCINSGAFLVGTEGSMSVLDFLMIGLAVYMQSQMQVRPTDRAKVFVLLAIGSFTGGIGFLKIGLFYSLPTFNIDVATFWNLVQLGTALLCCCMPLPYRPPCQVQMDFGKAARNGISSFKSVFCTSDHDPLSSTKPKKAQDSQDTVSHRASRRSAGPHTFFNLRLPSPSPNRGLDPGTDPEKGPQPSLPNDIYMGGEVPPYLVSTAELLRAKCPPQAKRPG